MNNYSITAIAINIYLSEAHPTKTRVAQAKAPRDLQIEAVKSIPGLENRFPPPFEMRIIERASPCFSDPPTSELTGL